MHLTVSTIYLILCLVNLAVAGKKYKEYHLPAKYSSRDDVIIEPFLQTTTTKIEKVTFIENTVENVEHVGLPDVIETSSMRMETLLRKMKLDSFAQKCLKKGRSCLHMLDCCSVNCSRLLKRCA
ncbi:uncharacterized protein LOC111599495 [Drosophila hydei]|uniref:Uncharacterized protein LOC111599495 n=1 Tax=Drosophila hydei TaxID=7224 RepID=A0A6J1LSU4_DROHY|nr:uncharacterized protein LOC111599495 [Drosophila hydei]